MINKIIAISFLFMIEIFPQYGEVSVKLWADNKKSAYTFTLDDGLASQVFYGKSILDKYGFKGTFMVIADHLTPTPPGEWRYTAWSELSQLSLDGYEIGSHSLNHPDLTTLPLGDTLTPGTAVYEIYHSREKINSYITSQNCHSFAYPLSAYNEIIGDIAAKYYDVSRGAGTSPNSSVITGDEWMHVKSIAPLFDSPRNTLSDDLPELEFHKNLVDSSISQGGWMISMLHEIVPQEELPSVINLGLWNPISSEWLDLLCSWLNERAISDDIWIATMIDVTKYIKERNTFSSSIIFESENEIRLSVTDELNDLIYDYPLTVDITVPESWNKVRIVQGSTSTLVNILQSGEKYFIRTKVIPDGGDVILLKQDDSGFFSISGNIKYYNTGQPVGNVLLIAKGIDNVQVTAVSNSSGQFSIDNLPPGTYNISLEKNDEYNNVNATDAHYILRFIDNQLSLDSIQQKAADVDISGNIDTLDTKSILDRFTRIIDGYEVSDWLFFPENVGIMVTDINIQVDFQAIKAGDVHPD